MIIELCRMRHNTNLFYSTGPEAPTSCEELVCSYGASCIEENGQAHCECPSPDCDEKNKTKVCFSTCLHFRKKEFDLNVCNTVKTQRHCFSGLQGVNMCSHLPSLHLCHRGAGVWLRWGDLCRPVPAEDHSL